MSAGYGLYSSRASVIHSLPAGAKVIGLALLIAAITVPPITVWLLAGSAVVVVALYLLARLGLGELWRQLYLIRWPVVLVLVSQLIFLPVLTAVGVTSRMIVVIALAALITLTTRTTDLLAAIEFGLGPARRIGINPTRVGMVLAMTIRTVPVIAGFAGELRDAQRARGIRFRLRAFFVPLLVHTLRQSDQLADALRARGIDD